MAKILFTIPNMGWVRAELMHTFARLADSAARRGHQIVLYTPTGVPLEANQAGILKKLRESDFDFWLSMDDDTFPTEECDVLDLVDLDLDVVCCPIPVMTSVATEGLSFMHWAAYDYDPVEDRYREHKPKEGLQPVSAIGGGCFLIAARVWRHRDMAQGPFMRTYHKDGTVRFGNDLSFSIAAIKAGFKLWTHYHYPCHHMKTVDLGLMMATVGRAYAQGRDDGAKGGAAAHAPEAQPDGAAT